MEQERLKKIKVTKKQREIHFEYLGEISAKDAKQVQGVAGYLPAGYGFYGFKVTETKQGKVTQWSCSSSCD